MSRVAHEFWNHKRIAQAEARQRLKALGILTGDDASIVETVAEVMRKHFAPAMAKALFAPRPSLLDLLVKKGRAVGPSTQGQMYKDSSQ